MADPKTTNVLLAVPTHGSDVDTWDQPLNNDFSSIDGFIGGTQIITISGGITVLSKPAGTVTAAAGPTESQNALLRVTGALTSLAQVHLPLPGYMIVQNLTSGAFPLLIRSTGLGQFVSIEKGSTQHVCNNGTDTWFVNLPSVGSYLDVCDTTVPEWITTSSIPPYLLCDGSSFSAITYPYLADKLGGTVLPDFRGRNSYYLNSGTGRLTASGAGIDGNTRFASGGANGIALAANQIPSLTSSADNSISVTSSATVPRNYSTNTVGTPGSGTPAAFPTGNNIGVLTSTGVNAISVTYTNSSLQIVGNAAPGIVSGLRLIRSA